MNKATRILTATGTSALLLAAPVVAVATPAWAATENPTGTVTAPVINGVQELTNENAAANGVQLVAPTQLPPRALQANPYTVSIVSLPNSARAAQQVYLKGKSTGFADGNWVNVWITGPDGVQRDAGGNWVRAGKFTIPVTFPSSGQYKVQLSLGAYPDEQYSQTDTINVTPAYYSTKPVVQEFGDNGKRYLQAGGLAKGVKPGKQVYVYVTRPGHLLPTMVGTAVVQSDGTYLFQTPNNASELNKDGLYWVNVSRANNPFETIGITTYYNNAY